MQNKSVCLTSTGFLVHENKILLVLHKKLGIWLAPGGHIEENELPHEAAEREFFEETGLKVHTLHYGPLQKSTHSQFVPNPFCSNLHEINRPRGTNGKFCQLHLAFEYLMELDLGEDISKINNDDDGVDDIGWFTLEEIQKFAEEKKTIIDVYTECKTVLELHPW
jgi:ADP-ribose pyrophosphatase YjhB (NUDIX family)